MILNDGDLSRTKKQEKRQRQVISAVVIPKHAHKLHSSWKFTRYCHFAVEIPSPSREVGKMDLQYEVLDLAIHGIETSQICRKTMKFLTNSRRIIVVAGAGISVAAGIPDFRSPAGLFSTLKANTKFKPSGKALFDASVYKVRPHSL